MVLNYHELTMNEPRDSPARRKQFIVICTVMAGMFTHGMMTAGAFSSLNIKEGVFPGGTFVYKLTSRDYAASGSLVESIANDAKIKKREYGDLLYSLYLDDPLTTGGRTLRFACGILVDRKGKDIMKALLGMNDEIRKLQTPDDEDIPAFNLWKRITYESISLPSLDAAVVQFPYTNGIVSALVLSYRIIPGLRKYAKEHGEPNPVVISTCSPVEEMCTHYAPLLRGKKFLLGQYDAETYLKSLPEQKFFDFKAAGQGLKRLLSPMKWLGF